jgi:hypothetical protein
MDDGDEPQPRAQPRAVPQIPIDAKNWLGSLQGSRKITAGVRCAKKPQS